MNRTRFRIIAPRMLIRRGNTDLKSVMKHYMSYANLTKCLLTDTCGLEQSQLLRSQLTNVSNNTTGVEFEALIRSMSFFELKAISECGLCERLNRQAFEPKSRSLLTSPAVIKLFMQNIIPLPDHASSTGKVTFHPLHRYGYEERTLKVILSADFGAALREKLMSLDHEPSGYGEFQLSGKHAVNPSSLKHMVSPNGRIAMTKGSWLDEIHGCSLIQNGANVLGNLKLVTTEWCGISPDFLELLLTPGMQVLLEKRLLSLDCGFDNFGHLFVGPGCKRNRVNGMNTATLRAIVSCETVIGSLLSGIISFEYGVDECGNLRIVRNSKDESIPSHRLNSVCISLNSSNGHSAFGKCTPSLAYRASDA
jgi:hypothetical protein